jgi:hypothetical protein
LKGGSAERVTSTDVQRFVFSTVRKASPGFLEMTMVVSDFLGYCDRRELEFAVNLRSLIAVLIYFTSADVKRAISCVLALGNCTSIGSCSSWVPFSVWEFELAMLVRILKSAVSALEASVGSKMAGLSLPEPLQGGNVFKNLNFPSFQRHLRPICLLRYVAAGSLRADGVFKSLHPSCISQEST